MSKEHKEIEARFLEIDKEAITKKLREIGAKDCGEELLSEVIFYDKEMKWIGTGSEFIKLRKSKDGIKLNYKNQKISTVDGTEEIEIKVSDFDKTKLILEKAGLIAFREQEKIRHKFTLGDIVFDIDTWPKVPVYLEIESDSEESVKKGAEKLGLSWDRAVFDNPRKVMEERYKIPIAKLRFFKFDKVE